ncbi:MAG: FAD-binding oxidoreductase [Anaerolineae bacterium]|nr:FAD-binding oxidoreductase [Anaerolineae bacterium]
MTDILIIGGGFAGTALAYFLARAGAVVTLLEAGVIGGGTSAACAGRVQIIESETEVYLDMVLAGFARLQTLEDELETDLEWRLPGHLTVLSNPQQWRQYERLVARLRARGVPAEMLDGQSLRVAEPLLGAEGALGAAYSHEGHLNPFKLCAGLARAARRLGVRVLTQTPVTGFEQQGGRIRAVLAGGQRYEADAIVLAAGAWSGGLAAQAGGQFPMKFSHAEAIVSEKLPPLLNHHIGMSGFYEAVHGDARTVTLGIGQHPGGSLLISNAVQQAQAIDRTSTDWGMPAVARAAQACFPRLAGVRILRTWSAPSPFLPDFLPALGWLPGFDNLYVAAGFHLAIPTIPLLTEAAAAHILEGVVSSWLAGFEPGRFAGRERANGSEDTENERGEKSKE